MEPSAQPKLTALASVVCLECEKVYTKPIGGGTVWANPGCPHCGYVGWLPLTAPDAGTGNRSRGRRRSAAVATGR